MVISQSPSSQAAVPCCAPGVQSAACYSSLVLLRGFCLVNITMNGSHKPWAGLEKRGVREKAGRERGGAGRKTTPLDSYVLSPAQGNQADWASHFSLFPTAQQPPLLASLCCPSHRGSAKILPATKR